MGSHSWMDCLADELFLNSCFSVTVFLTSLRTAAEAAISEVLKSLRAGGVPTSLTLLLLRWLTVSLVFTGRCARTSHSSLSDSPSLVSLMVLWTYSTMFTYLPTQAVLLLNKPSAGKAVLHVVHESLAPS